MSELSNYDHVPQQADPSISVSNSKKSPLFHPQYMPPVNNSFGHRQLSDSMAVQPDTDRNEGVLCSFSSDVEMEGNAVREKPASLPAAIARGLGHVSMAFNGQPLVGPIGMDIGEEEASSTSSNDCSSTGSGYQLNTAARAAGTSPGHHNIERQVSEECNMKQPYSARDAMQRVRTWDITQPAMVDPHGASSRWTSVDKCNNNGSVGRPTGAAGRVGCDKEQPTSLQQLVKLSKLPDHYMPDTKYKTIVADQQIDELPNGKAIQGIKVSVGKDGKDVCIFLHCVCFYVHTGTHLLAFVPQKLTLAFCLLVTKYVNLLLLGFSCLLFKQGLTGWL